MELVDIVSAATTQGIIAQSSGDEIVEARTNDRVGTRSAVERDAHSASMRKPIRESDATQINRVGRASHVMHGDTGDIHRIERLHPEKPVVGINQHSID